MLRMLADQLRHPVIADPRQLLADGRLAHRLQRRHAERDHLRVVVLRLEPLDETQALLQVEDRRNAAHPLGDVLAADTLHPLPDAGREEVVEAVDVAQAQLQSVAARCAIQDRPGLPVVSTPRDELIGPDEHHRGAVPCPFIREPILDDLQRDAARVSRAAPGTDLRRSKREQGETGPQRLVHVTRRNSTALARGDGPAARRSRAARPHSAHPLRPQPASPRNSARTRRLRCARPNSVSAHARSNAASSRSGLYVSRNARSSLIARSMKSRAVEAKTGCRSAVYESSNASPPQPCTTAAIFQPRLRASSNPVLIPYPP